MENSTNKAFWILSKIFGYNCRKKVNDYLYSMFSGVVFIGIGIYIGSLGWILFGSGIALIYLGGVIYALKTKKGHPLFDILYIVNVLAGAVAAGIAYYERGGWLLIGMMTIVVVLGSVVLWKQIAEWIGSRKQDETGTVEDKSR